VLGADREWNAIHRLHVGVDTMHGVGFGEKGLNR
jgi:heptose I phosphotransferase